MCTLAQTVLSGTKNLGHAEYELKSPGRGLGKQREPSDPGDHQLIITRTQALSPRDPGFWPHTP